MANKAALDNPLPVPSRIWRVATNLNQNRRGAPGSGCQAFDVVRRAKQGASCQVKDLMFQNLASRNYRVLQSCQLTHRKSAEDTASTTCTRRLTCRPKDGETARLKRTQGITQATGRFAPA